jgi:hypothetical protein
MSLKGGNYRGFVNDIETKLAQIEVAADALESDLSGSIADFKVEFQDLSGNVESISGELVTLKNDGQTSRFIGYGQDPAITALLTNTYIQDSSANFGSFIAGVWVYNVNITLSVSSGTWNENPDLQVIDYAQFSPNGVAFSTFAMPYATKTSATQVSFSLKGLFRTRDSGGNGTPSGPGLWLGLRPTFVFSTLGGSGLTPIDIQTQVIFGGFAKITN